MKPPLVTYSWNAATASVGRIVGSPGAAMEITANLPVALANALVAPGRDFLLGQQTIGGPVLMVRDLSGQPDILTLLHEKATLLAISPSADAAAFYIGSSRDLQVITGLPLEPKIAWTRVLPDFSHLGQIAVADGGRAVVIGADESTMVVSAETGPVLIGTRGSVSALGFIPASTDVIVSYRELPGLALIVDAAGRARATTIASEMPSASAVASSKNGAKIAVALSSSGTLVLLNRSTGEQHHLQVAGKVNRLSLADRSSLFVASAVDGHLALIDASGSEPVMLFVPRSPARHQGE